MLSCLLAKAFGVGRLLIGLLRWAFFRSQTDAFNFHAGQFATMSNCAVISFASLVLERDDLLILALFENFSRHLCSRNERLAMRHIISVGKHQYVTKGRDLSGIDLENIDVDRVAFRDAELSATSLNDCVSHSVWGEKAAQNSIDGPAWQTETFCLALEARHSIGAWGIAPGSVEFQNPER